MLVLIKQPCPSTDRSKTEKWLLDGTAISVALTAAQAKTAAQFCNQAIERAKQEGRISGDSFSWPLFLFDNLDYGYFFVVYVNHDARLEAADGTQTIIKLSRKEEYTNVALCPQLDSLASCEPVWKALQQPYIQQRLEIRELIRKGEIAANLDRDRRFAPLEAALKRKIMTMFATEHAGSRGGTP